MLEPARPSGRVTGPAATDQAPVAPPAGDTGAGTGQTRGMRPLDIHHVSINVPDVGEAVAFYTGTLGGTRRADRPDFGFDGAWIDLGGSQVHLLGATTPPALGQHFAIRVADLDAVVAELRDGGTDVADPTAVGPGRQTFLTDPAGNTVELYELVDDAPAP